MNNKKIGVGIITCNRPHYLKVLLDSISEDCGINELIVVNDGKPLCDDVASIGEEYDFSHVSWLQNKENLGVGKSKNKALKYLFEKGCDFIFLIEDDMVILDPSVFKQYIKASKVSGIQHFNYGPGSPFNCKQTLQHFDLYNRHLLDQTSEPDPRLVVDYKTQKISLYTHVTGMFSFYTKNVLNEIGFIDETYKNAWEHVDHTYQIIKAGCHPPFWWFADIFDSHKFIASQKDAIENSTTSKNTKEWLDNVRENAEIYKSKNGWYPAMTPQSTQEEVVTALKHIKNK